MAFSNFIPQVWNAQMLLDYRAQALAAALVNRSYEGDAAVGNTVKITTAVDIAMKDYKTAGRTTSPDAIDNTQLSLLIDQEKNFDFLVDDIDRRQAAGSLDVYSQSAGLSMALDADAHILATAEAGALAANKLDGAGVAPATAADAWDILRDLRKTLNQLHVPLAQRVAFVNAEFASLLLENESKITSVDTSGDGAGLREGTIGRILGFQIVESENMPTVDAASVIAFHQPAVSHVSQLTETEGMRDTDSFSDRIRGLHVYGSKVHRAKGVATWNVGTAG